MYNRDSWNFTPTIKDHALSMRQALMESFMIQMKIDITMNAMATLCSRWTIQ